MLASLIVIFRSDEVPFCSGLLYYHANYILIDVNALEQLPDGGNLSQLTFITAHDPVTDTAADNTHASDDSNDVHLSQSFVKAIHLIFTCYHDVAFHWRNAEFATKGYFSCAFPTLLPAGASDFLGQRQIQVTITTI